METKQHLEIKSEQDIILVRKIGRETAKNMGFSLIDQTRITTSISELARNVVKYAGYGSISIEVIHHYVPGLLIVVTDQGPGINSINKAMEDGFTTSNSLGAGLPAVKRMMDEFIIVSDLHEGTSIQIVKWTQNTKNPL
ncbi:anti-sigma regulatory factor [Sutcliffiella rhizosphaerae]|uniref:Serine/threonine-protein kinase RsbT n=1 Tax=Sutcliffiella rhizosphaerae TaxID=2880967 RepID=A0ABN8AG33_9BACI|nr:anti-sigma regulatory factor [Sutcliffiella rhizosphaerae]CAG9623224.1 Serine/threonine-protein kinase RsbT [Sutcliffiella rhizosphaerae]